MDSIAYKSPVHLHRCCCCGHSSRWCCSVALMDGPKGNLYIGQHHLWLTDIIGGSPGISLCIQLLHNVDATSYRSSLSILMSQRWGGHNNTTCISPNIWRGNMWCGGPSGSGRGPSRLLFWEEAPSNTHLCRHLSASCQPTQVVTKTIQQHQSHKNRNDQQISYTGNAIVKTSCL